MKKFMLGVLLCFVTILPAIFLIEKGGSLWPYVIACLCHFGGYWYGVTVRHFELFDAVRRTGLLE